MSEGGGVVGVVFTERQHTDEAKHNYYHVRTGGTAGSGSTWPTPEKSSTNTAPTWADNAYEVRPGWWVDTHASRAGIETRIRMAYEVAGVKFGKDLVINLG